MEPSEAERIGAVAVEAAVWALPFVLFARYLGIAEGAGLPRNRFLLDVHLSSPSTICRGANVDTLYGHVWLDLSDGPLLLQLPDAGDRYVSIQVVDAFQATRGYVGNHTSGFDVRACVLAPPGWTGPIPEGAEVMELPTALGLGVVRTRVDGPSDLDAARAVHTAARVGPLGADPVTFEGPVLERDGASRFPYTGFRGAGAGFFDELGELMVRVPPPESDRDRLSRFASIGIGPGLRPSTDESSAPILASALDRAVAEMERFAATSRTVEGEWMWMGLGDREIPEADPLLRAAVNYQGPALHIDQESTSPAAVVAHDGSSLDGSRRYRLHFEPGGLPPVDEFWSMTLYSFPEMQLVDNPIDRYAVGSATDGLVANDDGSLDVVISHDRPGPGDEANWLPSPAGPFMLLVRMYRPRAEVLERRYALPPILPE